MRVYKESPFEFSLMTWEVHPRRPYLMVVVKGTFDLKPDLCVLADEQTLVHGDEAQDVEGEAPSLALASDYALTKLRGEWYLKGSARSAGPVTVLPVRVQVGALHKQMAVWGDRHWKHSLLGDQPTDPEPFTEKLLCWERALEDGDLNPVGSGEHAVRLEDGTEIEPLANLESMDEPVVARGQGKVVGMSPIHPMWAPRLSKTGTYDEAWQGDRWPFFPADFHPDFFQCAPPDQQLPDGHWRGDEVLRLWGLSAEYSQLTTRLPGLRARVFIEWCEPRLQGERVAADTGAVGGPVDLEALAEPLLSRERILADGIPDIFELPIVLDTIVLDSDSMTATCSWRGLVEIPDHHLSTVRRLFVVHQPLDAEHPIAAFGQWLQRCLLAEHDEFEGEIDIEDGVVPPPVEASSAASDPPPEVVEPLDEEQFAGRGFALMLEAADYIDLRLAESGVPTPGELRRQMIEGGLEPADWLDDPPPVAEEPVLPESRSLLRLAAIIRRKLGRSFEGENLTDAPYARLDLSGVDFTNAILTGAEFVEANLSGARFDGATLIGATLTRSRLERASLIGADLSGANLSGANLDGANLEDSVLTEAHLRAAQMRDAKASRASLEEADLSGADLSRTVFDEADLSHAKLDEANLSQCSMVDCTLESASLVKANLERAIVIDLRAGGGADFSQAQCVLMEATNAQFQNARLSDAVFSGSDLSGADFSGARGQKVNFTRSNLRGACFDFSQLPLATWLQADLFEAQFMDADLRGGDFRYAHLFSAAMWRANMLGARLDEAITERTLIDES